MKKVIVSIALFVVSIVAGSAIISQDTSAKQKDPMDLVKSVSYMKAIGCGDHSNHFGATLFSVSFNWGAGCNSNICDEIYGSFHCTDPGDQCTTTSHVHNGSLVVSKASCPSSVGDSWECFKVAIPVDANFQDAEGLIKRKKEVDLTAYAKYGTGDNDYLNGGKPIDSDTVFYGSNASVTSANFNPKGYTWSHWGSGGVCADAGTNRKCTTEIKDDHKVNAYYELNEWQAQSIVTGAASATAGYSASDETATAFINNCDPVAGCQVSFKHKIKRTSGSGTTDYTVSRSSNLSDNGEMGVNSDDNVASGQSNSDGSEKVASTSGPFTLYPGMVVCETIKFKSHNTSGAEDVRIKVCASALGNAQPSDDPDPDNPENPNDPSGDVSLINIKVRNPSVVSGKYNNYQREVYAKPNDLISYRATYNPRLQYTYRLRPQLVQFNGDGAVIEGNNRSFKKIFEDQGLAWKNAFSLQFFKDTNDEECASYTDIGDKFDQCKSPNSASLLGNRIANPGIMSGIQPLEDIDRVVSGLDGGSSIDERAILNLTNETKTTPRQIKFTEYDGKNLGNVDTSRRFKVAYTRVPYNFINEIEESVENSKKDDIIYAGEVEEFSFDIKTKPRWNPVTEGEYATIVRDAKWKLIVCIGEGSTNCKETEPTKKAPENYVENTTIGDLNPNGKLEGETVSKFVKVNVPDVFAGTKVCVRAAVYPRASGEENDAGYKNWSDREGNHQWVESPEKCYTVAKRPSIQVWGGNVYSGGEINTGVSTKNNIVNHIAGNPSYAPESKEDPRTFGSWGELGVISNGAVIGFGSGASMGYAADRATDPGGSTTDDFCENSPLTFANDGCSSKSAGSVGNNASINKSEIDMQTIVSVLAANTDTTSSDAYKYSKDDIVIDGSDRIDASDVNATTRVRRSEKDIIIERNIEFDRGYNYKELPEIKRAVLYAKNIYIDCSVERVDAILIAENIVKTCVKNGKEAPDLDGRDRGEKQLVVNGAIIARKLEADRTFGAGPGMNSIVPAELINFDSTLLLFGRDVDTLEDNTGQLVTTYIYELAPRL